MQKAKRLLAGCLSALIALPLSMMGPAAVSAEDTATAGVQEPNHKVLATVMESGSANANTGGYQASNNDMHINVQEMDSTITYDDLALFINVYIENRENPDDFTIFEDSQGQFQFVSSIEKEDGKDVYYQACWNWNKANTFDLKPGWNTLQLNFSTEQKEEGIAANTCNIDLTNINNFRLGFWGFDDFANYDHYRIRIANAVLMDTRYAPEEEPVYEDTEPRPGGWPSITEETVYKTTNNYPEATTPLNSGNVTAAEAIDLSGHNPENVYLSLDMHVVDETDPDLVSDYFSSGQIRLYSQNSGESYAYFYSRTHYPNIIAGEWNHLELPLATINNIGNIDLSEINRIYIYFDSVNHAGEAGHTFAMQLRNVEFIDTTNDPVEMTLPTLFDSGMIFQQNKPIRVWGTAEAGDTVTAVLTKEGSETPVETLAPVAVAEDGTWEVEFKALEGGYDAYTITLTDTDAEGETRSEKVLSDILIGEVWVAAGQSNMALPVADDSQKDTILENAKNNNIRFYIEPSYPIAEDAQQPLTPVDSVAGAYWGSGDNAAEVQSLSSVGYAFAVQMQEELDMPVGILHTATGGTVIEAWISREAVESDEVYKDYLDDNDKYCDENWWPAQANRQSALYNQKIGPLEGYNVAGVIWYQGESNSTEPEIYDRALGLLQEDWSNLFGFTEEKIPFIFAQLAPHYYSATKGMSSSTYLAYMAESMSKAWAANPDTMGQIAIYDLPLTHLKTSGQSASPIHPTDKTPVGQRMATAAYNMVYGGEGETTSPVYESMEVKGNAIEVTFSHVGAEGLKIGNDSENLQGFAIAGADGVYVNAQAEIVDEDTVRVWSDWVAAPQNVTYAFTTFNMAGNLAGSDGFAAIPFRTSTETVDANLFHSNDWMYADGEVWTSLDTSNAIQQAAFNDLWTVAEEGATHSYDAEDKSEGKASLKVEYTGTTATIAPVLGVYRSLENQFENFGGLSVDMKNPDDRAKEVKLVLQSGGNTYTSADTATLAAGSDFTRLAFSLEDLLDADGEAVADVQSILANVTALQFVVTDTEAGTVNLDNIQFAMTLDMRLQLGTLLEQAKAEVVKTDVYTAESIASLNSAITAAQAVYDRAEATQEEIVAQAMALNTAFGNLAEIAQPTYQLGDVDGNGQIAAADALLALQAATDKIDLSDAQLAAANVDGEDGVSAADALMILQYATQKITSFGTAA